MSFWQFSMWLTPKYNVKKVHSWYIFFFLILKLIWVILPSHSKCNCCYFFPVNKNFWNFSRILFGIVRIHVINLRASKNLPNMLKITQNLRLYIKFWDILRIFAKFFFALKFKIWVVTYPNEMHDNFLEVLFRG